MLAMMSSKKWLFSPKQNHNVVLGWTVQSGLLRCILNYIIDSEKNFMVKKKVKSAWELSPIPR